MALVVNLRIQECQECATWKHTASRAFDFFHVADIHDSDLFRFKYLLEGFALGYN